MASQSVSKPHPLNLGLLCEMKGIMHWHDKKTFFFVNDLTIRIRWRKSLQQNLQLNSERALKCEEIQHKGNFQMIHYEYLIIKNAKPRGNCYLYFEKLTIHKGFLLPGSKNCRLNLGYVYGREPTATSIVAV